MNRKDGNGTILVTKVQGKRRAGSDLLTRDHVVETALSLIDERGLDGFSVRELARALGVFPTALYWHVKGGRNEMLAAVAARALEHVAPEPGAGDDWKDWLRQLFHRYRKALSRHPNVAPLLGAQLVSNAGVNPELVERILAALHGAGFHGAALVDAYNATLAAMLGYVTLEFAPSPSDEPDRWAKEFQQALEALPEGRYPHLQQNFQLLANRAFVLRWESGDTNPLVGGFEMFVEAFVLGLERKLQLAAGERS